MNKCSLPSIFYFLIIVSFLFNSSMSFKPLRHYCMKAAKSDPNFSYDFCVACLEPIPRSHNATLEELTVIAVNLTISNATNISSYILQLMKNNTTFAKEALQACSQLYLDAHYSLHDAICDLRSKDYSKANIDVSAAMTNSDTCEDGFKERKGGVSPLTKENDIFFKLSAIDLAFINMLS